MKAEELSIFDTLDHLLQESPDKILLSNGAPEELTAEEVDTLSGRVYRYLKERGIGKEKMVNILLPRGMNVFVSLLGVWKAGAAAVLLESSYAPERVAFIQNDLGCALILDEGIWEEILKTEPLPGHEPLDPHAAAFAVYTSGTTGNPKGVLHEYGKIPRAAAALRWEGEWMFGREESFALLSPMNFVATIMAAAACFITGFRLLVVPASHMTSPQAILHFFLEEKVTGTFFPPSLFRIIDDFNPCLKRVIVSGEPANGLWKPREEMMLWNTYGSSEAGTEVCAALLDQPNEVAPIGRPQYDVRIFALREDGGVAGPGETGELCHEVPFTRGYVHLPEENARVFADGVYHTGDLVRVAENGDFYLIGRLNDTIKINGNRIEPAEVEEAIKKVTGVRWTAVRAFIDEHRSYLCAYHLGDARIGIVELREKLSAMLPDYMLPSYFMKIDAIPKNANGKMERRLLPQPEKSDYEAEYEAPSDEIQGALCRAMARILSRDRVGIHDDFFLLGGDSLLSMQLLGLCDLDGFEMKDLYLGRTPCQIAEILKEKIRSGLSDPEEMRREALAVPLPVNAEQRYMIDYQNSAPDSTMYNLPLFLHFEEDVTAEDLADAVKRTVENRPALLSIFYPDEGGRICQRYAPERMPQIRPETVTEEELLAIRPTLIRPYELTGGLLFRCRIFCAPSGLYLFFEVHHAICDGFSLRRIFEDIQSALMKQPLPRDYWYSILYRREREQQTEAYEKSRKYFEDRYGKTSWSYNLPHDREQTKNTSGEIYMDFPGSFDDFNEMQQCTGLGKNGLFLAAGLLALSAGNHEENVLVEWIYSGRKDKESLPSVGVLFHTLPAALALRPERTLGDVLADLAEQTRQAVLHSDYPYASTTYSRPVEQDTICFLYQENLTDIHSISRIGIEAEELEDPCAASQGSLDVEIRDVGDKTILFLDYAAGLYRRETIKRYGEILTAAASRILACRNHPEITIGEILSDLSV